MFRGTCYTQGSRAMTNIRATERCSAMGARLVEISDEEEHDVILHLIESKQTALTCILCLRSLSSLQIFFYRHGSAWEDVVGWYLQPYRECRQLGEWRWRHLQSLESDRRGTQQRHALHRIWSKQPERLDVGTHVQRKTRHVHLWVTHFAFCDKDDYIYMKILYIKD